MLRKLQICFKKNSFYKKVNEIELSKLIENT